MPRHALIPLCLSVTLNIVNYNICPLLMFEIKIQNDVKVSNELQGKGEEDKLPIPNEQAASVGMQ